MTTATMSHAGVIFYFFICSMAMFTFPFAAYFGTHYILRDVFNVDGFSNIVWSVIASVVAVNIIIALYAYKAYYEPEGEITPSQDTDQPLPRVKRSDLNLKQE